jgi:CheY-like chemotaxis protein
MTCRTVALVGRYTHKHLFEAAGRVGDQQVVFIESTAHAYSKIKMVRPDLIVMCLANNDVDGCQVLSMLALDEDTAGIPVLAHVGADGDSVAGATPVDDENFWGSWAGTVN